MLEPPDCAASVPRTLSVPVAGVLTGVSLPTAYRLAASGSLPLLPVGGRHRVVTAKLEQMLGIKLTPEMLAQAQRQVDRLTKKSGPASTADTPNTQPPYPAAADDTGMAPAKGCPDVQETTEDRQ
jgi:hypothetical protein